jgi:hypothetical protein
MERLPATQGVTHGRAKSIHGNAGLAGIGVDNTKADNMWRMA